MDTFFEYWKKGWKVILMIFCINLASCLLAIPLAIGTAFLSGGRPIASFKGQIYFWWIILYIIFVPGISYFIFKAFYGER